MSDRQELDRECVGRAQAGDEAAFTELMGHYKGPVLNFVYRLTGDAAGAEDIAQETFVRAYRNLDRFSFRKPGDRFSTWLFQVARNAAIDAMRHRQHRPAQSLEVTPEGQIITDPSDPSDQADLAERSALIAAVIAELPEDQRTALVLSVYEEFSYAEIASVMETTEKSVESRLYRARQFLRLRLNTLLG
jgi:RNA polymerase sigma-70 factor (ECF subfamily)